jgi:hypothetical protein
MEKEVDGRHQKETNAYFPKYVSNMTWGQDCTKIICVPSEMFYFTILWHNLKVIWE